MASPTSRRGAYFEDLISFLEMNGLSGAYALALAGNGIQNLQQLLTLNEKAAAEIVSRCNTDATEEILLLDALRKSRVQA
jgi:hypothetical protein